MTLTRLFQPKSIAVIGGGAWCEEVIHQARGLGYDGDIWPVHTKADIMAGHTVFNTLDDLPFAPDAAFIGINRNATIDIVQTL